MSKRWTRDKDGDLIPFVSENKEMYIDELSQCITELNECVLQIKMLKQERNERKENFGDDEISYIHEILYKKDELRSAIENYHKEYYQ